MCSLCVHSQLKISSLLKINLPGYVVKEGAVVSVVTDLASEDLRYYLHKNKHVSKINTVVEKLILDSVAVEKLLAYQYVRNIYIISF